jgi:hypothetical protein
MPTHHHLIMRAPECLVMSLTMDSRTDVSYPAGMHESLHCIIVQLLKNFPAFYVTENSSPYTQEPSSGPCPEPDPSSPTYLSNIHFNIVHLPTSWSSYWSLSFWLSHQYPICIPLLPIRATCPVNLILLDLIILVQVMKLLIM